MRTKEIVNRTGIDRETLRFYEDKGLINTPERTESGYRIYTPDTIDRITFILTAKRAGFSLNEILDLIDMKASQVTCRDGRAIAQTKLDELAEKQKALKDMQKILKKFITACEAEGEKGLNRPCHLSFDTICCDTKGGKS